MDIDKGQLDRFEQRLRTGLVEISTSKGALGGKMLESDDLKDFWKRIEPNYMADAVSQINEYPTVAVAWAAYIGMAAAHYWDADWQNHKGDAYESLYGTDGFDNMDDHIVCDILKCKEGGNENKQIVSLAQSLADVAVSAIRYENVEPQSPMAFYVFARACRAMFAIGAAVELHKLGYSLQKVGN